MPAPPSWPNHMPRTPQSERRSAPYRTKGSYGNDGRSWALIRQEVMDAVDRIGKAAKTPCTLLDLSTGHDPGRLRNDGTPYSGAAEPDDPGVVVVFAMRDKKVIIPADRFYGARDNARAIWYYLDQMARSLRDGVGTIEAAFGGFTALPAEAGSTIEADLKAQWDAMLATGVGADDAYRILAKKHHPDRGGDEDAFQVLTRLRDDAHQQVVLP